MSSLVAGHMLNMHEALGLVPRTQQRQQEANEYSHYRQFVWFPKGKERIKMLEKNN